jgi:hypothetical protein
MASFGRWYLNGQNGGFKRVLLLILLATRFGWAQGSSVPSQYRGYFHHYVDQRSIPEKALNLVGLTTQDVGRSFALIAGVTRYPNFKAPLNPILEPAAQDIQDMEQYLERQEFFDEIVVLRDGDMTFDNLQYFLQVYFPERLKASPHSRFLFAYSGHGITDGSSGYLLESTAESLDDRNNALDLSIVHVLVQHVVNAGYQTLVLLNACYGGAFLKNSFTPSRSIPKKPGAYAITAGGSRERTWSDPSVGKGSLFFETVFKGLAGAADLAGDGIITAEELAAYLKKQIQIFTDQSQNPQSGNLLVDDEHVGSFFFLNRTKMVQNKVVPAWNPGKATPFGEISNSDRAAAASASSASASVDVVDFGAVTSELKRLIDGRGALDYVSSQQRVSEEISFESLENCVLRFSTVSTDEHGDITRVSDTVPMFKVRATLNNSPGLIPAVDLVADVDSIVVHSDYPLPFPPGARDRGGVVAKETRILFRSLEQARSAFEVLNRIVRSCTK